MCEGSPARCSETGAWPAHGAGETGTKSFSMRESPAPNTGGVPRRRAVVASESLGVLIAARAVQGVGSAASWISALALLSGRGAGGQAWAMARCRPRRDRRRLGRRSGARRGGRRRVVVRGAVPDLRRARDGAAGGRDRIVAPRATADATRRAGAGGDHSLDQIRRRRRSQHEPRDPGDPPGSEPWSSCPRLGPRSGSERETRRPRPPGDAT